MEQSEAFDALLERLAYLSDGEFDNLPEWQRSLTLVHQFALDAMGDGVGSLFYNHPERVDGVVQALLTLGELELAEGLRATARILEPFVADGPPNWQEILVEQCLEGVAAQRIEELGKLLDERWGALYAKLEELARSNGWGRSLGGGDTPS